MTAIDELQRLEAPGAWRPSPDARLIDVIVSVGEATLILSDPKSEEPLSHWSLPAITRLNPGEVPALYAPWRDTNDEQLEIDDEWMISAIDRVQSTIEKRRARPGRLRKGIAAFAVAAMLAVGFFWLPPALTRHAARIAPPAQASYVGKTILDSIERSTGAECGRQSGRRVTDHLAARVVGETARISIVPAKLDRVIRLPGNLYVVSVAELASQSSAEALSGALLAAASSASEREVILEALQAAGPQAVIKLLTSGKLPEASMHEYAEELLINAAPQPDQEALVSAFETKGIPTQPYAVTLPEGSDMRDYLLANDPFRDAAAPAAILTDRQWLALQQICN